MICLGGTIFLFSLWFRNCIAQKSHKVSIGWSTILLYISVLLGIQGVEDDSLWRWNKSTWDWTVTYLVLKTPTWDSFWERQSLDVLSFLKYFLPQSERYWPELHCVSPVHHVQEIAWIIQLSLDFFLTNFQPFMRNNQIGWQEPWNGTRSEIFSAFAFAKTRLVSSMPTYRMSW